MGEGGQKVVGDFNRTGNMHRGREGIVGALAHIHMVIGVNGLF